MSLVSTTAVPYEVLNRILDFFEQEDVLRLSLTSRQYHSDPILRKHIYRHLVNSRDVPGTTDSNAWKSWRSRGETLFQGLNEETGGFVRGIAIPRYIKYPMLDKVVQYCTNLEEIDFSGIEDSLGICEVRNDLKPEFIRAQMLARMKELGLERYQVARPSTHNWPCRYWFQALRAPSEGLRWSAALVAYPTLFTNVKSVTVNFPLGYYHYAGPRLWIPEPVLLEHANCFPMLLAATPKLQSLTVRGGRSHWLPQYFMDSINKPSVFCSSPSLKTLTLIDYAMDCAYFGSLFGSWKLLKSIQVLNVSLHSDLRHIARAAAPHVRYMPEYVNALMSASADNSLLKFQSCDTDQSAKYAVTMKSALSGLSKTHLAFLHSIGWRPTFLWIDPHLTTTRWSWKDSSHKWIKDSNKINRRRNTARQIIGEVLDRLDDVGIAVRIQLTPHNPLGLFFADHNLRDPQSKKKFSNPDITKWLLQDFGPRFDELAMLWDPALAFTDIDRDSLNALETNLIPVVLKESREWGQQADYEILEELAREAHGAAQLFSKITIWFPKIRRLALYIPAPIYPSTDQEFIDHFLPCDGDGSETWEVQHHNSGGGIEHTLTHPTETNMGYRYELDGVMRKYNVHIPPSEILNNALPYPMLHRVFTKTSLSTESGNSKYLKTLETERNWMYPPHPPTVTDLLDGKGDWTEKPWMEILR
ncbi:MAG: hypothetical protein Q9168_005663, partial [Polycauliona sp. 1 TL-2023]